MAAANAEARARLALLAEELKRGRIVEARLVEPGYHVHGLCDRETDAIIIDPAPATVSTLLHELLHRRYPRWGERRVSDTAHRLVTAMSDEERRVWYRRYRKAAKARRRPVKVVTE